MLIDRDRIIRDIYNNEARTVIGPFAPNSAYYDNSIKPWPCDVGQAKKFLAEAGWQDVDNDGILEKDGRNSERAVIIRETLKELREKL